MSWDPCDRTGQTWRDEDGVVFLVTGQARRVRGTGTEEHPALLLSPCSELPAGATVFVHEARIARSERVT